MIDTGDYYVTHALRRLRQYVTCGPATTSNLRFNWWPLVC